MICRTHFDRLAILNVEQGSLHEALRGDIGRGGTEGVDGNHEQGLTPLAESGQRVGPAQLRRRRVQQATGDRGGHSGHSADQHAQGGPGQEAFCGSGARGGAWRPSGSPGDLPAQGRRRIRGALGGAELWRPAGWPRAMVAAAAGRPCGGTGLHRQRVTRDSAAGSKKTKSSLGVGSGG